MNKIKITLLVSLLVLGVFVGYTKTFADLTCPNGQVECNDQCVSECSGGKQLDSSCSCVCGSNEDECLGSCYTQCEIGQSRDAESCECVNDECSNGANNPPDCDECSSGQSMCEGDGQCYGPCTQQGYVRDSESCECVPSTCNNGAINPPLCNNCGEGKIFNNDDPPVCIVYCNDAEACNYGAYAACIYEGCEEFCCADTNALNYDDECPDETSDPKKIENNSGTCEYCTSDSDDARCKVYYCPDPEANNFETQADCQASNPDRNCIAGNPSAHCTYDPVEFCGDTTTPALNAETQTDCNNSIPEDRRPCSRNDSLCRYPDRDYCADENATNYETEADCNGGNQNINCTPHYNRPVCQYNDSCLIAFLVDVTCPNGYRFANDITNPFVFDRALIGGACTVVLTQSESNILSSYIEQLICSETTPTCSSGLCDAVDWCPQSGVQTDPAECVDVCPGPDNPGNQINVNQCNNNHLCVNLGNIPVPSGYYINQDRQCFPCKNGVCNPVSGVCGSISSSGASYVSDITGTAACSSGTKSTVTKNGKIFNWSCLGSEGGLNQGCQANLMCANGLTYCENKGICSNKCYLGNDCANSNICVFKGNVSLNRKLDVTPIVDRNGTCKINIGKDSEVFDAFDVTTHCTLSSQDGVIRTFDPADLTSDGEGITTYSMPNVKKDMTYMLKCHDGDITDETTYETSVGSCRLNIRTLEAN